MKVKGAYEEWWERLRCLLLEGNDKGHNIRPPVHKLVTGRVVVHWKLVRQKEVSFVGSKADLGLVVRTKS